MLQLKDKCTSHQLLPHWPAMTLHMHPAIPSSYSSLNTFGDCGARFVICCCVALKIRTQVDAFRLLVAGHEYEVGPSSLGTGSYRIQGCYNLLELCPTLEALF